MVINMIYSDLEKNINKIESDYNNSIDISFRDIILFNTKIYLVYNSSLCDNKIVNDFILKNISNLEKENIKKDDIINVLYNTIPSVEIEKIKNFENIYEKLGNGFVIILFDKKKESLAIEAKKELSRAIEQPVVEQAILGPKDSFNENYLDNIGLIRKRIKTNNLIVEEKIIGKETKSKVGILYMKNIIEQELLDSVKEKLDKIDVDGIIDSNYIKEYIESKNNVFTLIYPTERPDVAVMNLLKGKICIIVENSPGVLIIPTFFTDLFNASEDYYQKSKNVIFTRIIRYISLFIAIVLPDFYIAITTFNHETIPESLLINFALQREGVPFPAFVEALGMTLIFEILRESDIRMPSLSGSAISILGAIVLGDAAVAAGIVSPIMVIVVAVSAICSLMFTGQAMVNGIRFWKLLFMIFATTAGIPGVTFCGFIFIIMMASLKSFGKPYLWPFAPFNLNFAIKSIFKKDIKNDNLRNPLLTDDNLKRSKKL